MVLLFGVDFGFCPVEDPELVVGSHVDQRDRDGTRAGLPSRRRREENIADEVAVGGIGGGVDAEPIEMRRRVNAGPSDRDPVARFGYGVRGDGNRNVR